MPFGVGTGSSYQKVTCQGSAAVPRMPDVIGAAACSGVQRKNCWAGELGVTKR